MILQLVADRDAFAASRRGVLEEGDRLLGPAVLEALENYGQESWADPIVRAARVHWLSVFDAEFPETSPLRETVTRFLETLSEHLTKTTAPDPATMADQAARIATWVSTYATNSATEAAALADTEQDLTLEWVTMHDSAVRESHREADGQTVGLGETFEIDGHNLHYPGEPVGPPEVWIRCRCVVRPGLRGGDMSTRTEKLVEAAIRSIELDTAALGAEPVDLDALTAAAESDEVDADAPTLPDDFDMGPLPWHGVLTVEGLRTGDRRMFAKDGLRFDTLPLPLRWQKADQPGHDGSVPVARIDAMWRDGDLIKAEGVFLETPEALEVVNLIGEKVLRGVSVDVDDVTMELQDEDGGVFDFETAADADRPVEVYTEGRIRSAAICSIPAFAEAFVALGPWEEPTAEVDEEALAASASDEGALETYNDFVARGYSPYEAAAEAWPEEAAEQFAPGTRDGPGWITHPRATQRITNYWVRGPGAAKIGWGAPNDFYRCRRQLAKYVQNPNWLAGLCANLHKRALGIWPGEHDGKAAVETEGSAFNADCHDCMDALTASGMQTPTEWFLDPQLQSPTALTVTEDGRVFGHIATWGTCHIGMQGACVTPPQSYSDYTYFHQRSYPTPDGPLPVGVLTVGTGHAPIRASSAAALAHYDNTGTAAAFVRAGEDSHGVWVAGVVNPYANEEQAFALKTAAISGDWRTLGGHLELVAALAVNVPGYPIPRTALAASGGVQTALIAAGVVSTHRLEDLTAAGLEPLVEEALANIRAREDRITRANRVKERVRDVRRRDAAALLAAALGNQED